jgi:hypothetical protein
MINIPIYNNIKNKKEEIIRNMATSLMSCLHRIILNHGVVGNFQKIQVGGNCGVSAISMFGHYNNNGRPTTGIYFIPRRNVTRWVGG